jgi:hypothetical protein
MAASELTVRKRVTEILNACAAGTFSEAVDYNYFDRNSLAIRQAIKEGALTIARTIVSSARHVHRGLFVSNTPTEFLTSGAELPDMSGEMDLIEIQPYEDGPWQTGVPREVQQIEAYRANPSNLYSTLAHDAENSPLGGYYAITNQRLHFTGYKARGYFPVINQSTVHTIIPDEYESTWVALSVGKTVKEGDNLFEIASYYYQMGVADLAVIEQMGVMQPLPTPIEAMRARGA